MVASPAQSAERLLYGTLLVLTFVSGLIDAASFLALGHVFTANMTGNMVFMGFALAGVPSLSLGRSAVALLAALCGGVAAGRLDSKWKWKKRTKWLAAACVMEAIAVAGAACVAGFSRVHLAEQGTLCSIIALSCFGMGIRNATVRRLAVPDLTTTVLTLTIAGLAFESSIAGGANARWRIRVSSIAMMFLGAVVGALILRISLALLLGLAALLTAGCALLQLYREETEHEAKLSIR